MAEAQPDAGAAPQQRPPLYVRRPFVAGLVRQAPLLAALLAVAAGLLLVALGHWRRGLVVIGLAMTGTAVLRLLLPLRRVGLLAVRSRWVDVLMLAGTGLALTVLTLTR